MSWGNTSDNPSRATETHELSRTHKEKLIIVQTLIHPSSCPPQIVILIFGCAEVLMGFQLAQVEDEPTSYAIYIPFWQGALVHNFRPHALVFKMT